MTNEASCHPEPSAAESKDPAALPISMATGFLDCARNDIPSFVIRASCFFRHSSFVLRHFRVMIALKDNLGSEFVERVRGFFSENGPLSKAKNFEFRPQQQEMAARVAQALEEEQHLIVEAGTGVGKSLGYLVPSVLFALERHKKAIVSTHTINLQEQLLHKDIPILKKVLPVEFEAALMKGRQNYLCPRRLERALQNEQELFTGPERSELQRLAEWARDNARWIAQRSVRRTRSKSLGASVQRSAYLHSKDLWPKSALFLSAGPQTSAGGGRDRAQSHAAVHFAWIARHAGRT